MDRLVKQSPDQTVQIQNEDDPHRSRMAKAVVISRPSSLVTMSASQAAMQARPSAEIRRSHETSQPLIVEFGSMAPELVQYGHLNLLQDYGNVPFLPDAEHPPEAKNLDVFEIISKENEKSSLLLHAGDIIVKPGRSAIRCQDSSCFWPKSSDGTVQVPYTVSGFGASDVAKITEAMKEFTSMTCIRFVNRTAETDYVQISSGNG
ncbi:hatching enzyme 1.2-like [Pleurodeles waltl]|uniref:hatching enzyme 1.2-like n=1 Tax=Pleurodeles waltl TaxID=8319 RepID=UPI003709C1E2